MRRPLAIVVGATAAVAAIVALYTAYWFVAANELRAGIESWAAARRAEGWVVAYREPEIGGYPLALRAALASPRLARPGGLGAWVWRGPTLIMTARPWRLDGATIEAPGRHRIAFATAHGRRAFEVDARAARFDVEGGGDGRVRAAAMEAGGLVLRPVAPPAPQTTAATATARWRAPATGAASPATTVAITLARVKLPAEARPPLGREIASVVAEISLLGPLHGARPAAALARWRQAGGTLEVARLGFVWGGVAFDGDGTAALDARLQPIAAMTARIRGYRAMVDALAAAGHVKGADTFVAKLALGMMARATPGGDDRITVPLTIQDRQLSIGPLKLMRLPAIEWQ